METRSKFGIAENSLNEAFPYHIACERNLTVHRVGRSLNKATCEATAGKHISQIVTIEEPNIALTYDGLHEAQGTSVLAKLKSSGLLLRGQFVAQESGGFLFLGHPQIADVETLHSIDLSDSAMVSATSLLHGPLRRESESPESAQFRDVIRSIQETASATEELRQTEASLERDLNASGDMLIRLTAHGVILDIRASRPDCLQEEPARYIGRRLRDVMPEVSQEVQNAIELGEDRTRPTPFEYRLYCGDEIHFFQARIAKTTSGDYLLLARDVTDRRILEQRLEYRSLHDPLTDLANRNLFSRNASAAQRRGKNIALLLIDVDGFKSINDAYGHAAGDHLLMQLACRIKECTRGADTAARLGGDEFGLLLTDVDNLETTKRVATRLHESLCHPIVYDGTELSIGVSIGVAFDSDGMNIDELIRNADFAMYRAKHSGKQQVVICDDVMRGKIQDRKDVEHGLVTAIENREFVPFYQPIIDLKSRRLSGFEALVRWGHPSKGILSPFVFLGIAEETGLVKDIGQQMLSTACQDAVELLRTFPDMEIAVNVNLAPQQMQDEGLLDVIDRVLHESQLPPKHLTLELTESALMEDIDKAKRIMEAIQQRGSHIALDDFGVGYSSLSYIQNLPIDILKLDRSFLSKVNDEKTQYQIVDCVVKLGQTLGMRVVAEGIEDVQQLKTIMDLGCDSGQGFLFSKPVPFLDAVDFIIADKIPGLHDLDQTSPAPSSIQTSVLRSDSQPLFNDFTPAALSVPQG